jgi:hypothetical protein
MTDGMGHKPEVSWTQGITVVRDRQQRVALQNEERLLERVPVSRDVTTGLEFDECNRQVCGTVVRPEEGRHPDALSRFARVRPDELKSVSAVDAQGSGSAREAG